jgi:restriction system protein
MGTPQNPVDWSDPDKWINERLKGDLQAFANKIWQGSSKTLNPRYLYDSYLFINKQKLLVQDGGIYRLNDARMAQVDPLRSLPPAENGGGAGVKLRKAGTPKEWKTYLRDLNLQTPGRARHMSAMSKCFEQIL